MVQSQTVTNTGIQEWVVLMSDASAPAATAMNKIVALSDSSTCTAAVASTFADPADAAVHHTEAGLDIAAMGTMAQGTTNTAGDTVEFDHVFTATATKNVSGIHACNDDGDITFVECCFNAVIAMENTDTLTIDGAVAVDQA